MDSATAVWEGGRVRVRVCAATDVGLHRAVNEDRYATWIPSDPGELNRRGVLLVVADGMGGARGGEVASRMVVEGVVRSYREGAGGTPAEALRAALAAANRAIHRESVARSELAGMGTTCTAAVLLGDELVLAHVGDSRAYLVRDGSIRQLTHDHSFVGQLVREGQLTPEQARSDPRRNVVTRGVGIGGEVEIDLERLAERLAPGDTLLLCTDGLHGLAEDAEIAAVASGRELERACGELVALANARGGIDNVTVILARLESPGDGPGASAGAAVAGSARVPGGSTPGNAPGGTRPARLRGLMILGFVLALLALLAAIAWRLAQRRANAI